ncbi:MAG: PVC-type heme-binding CxxCH protein [Planctomycetaceae bacterium]
MKIQFSARDNRALIICSQWSLAYWLFGLCLSVPALSGQETGPPLSPKESAEQFDVFDSFVFEQVLAEPHVRQPLSMKFDERGRLWVAEYIQYPYPAGLKTVSRDSYYRTVYDKKPIAPPNHERGADRISIHEDTNGDGAFDTHSTFLEGTSLTTSFAFDRDGVWVLNPPYLLFYPDANKDDVPDADPVVHLEGFGIEDTHSCANSLCWGPDGWLYGAQGSTVSGRVLRTGIDTEPVTSMGQLIWRYHPTTRQYEIFAEGGGNAFGVEFDSKGRLFSGHNGGDTRGFHYVQGGYFQKGFSKHGPLSNPFAFGYFSWMGTHKLPRFTHDFVIYEGGAFPNEHNGRLFGIGPLQSHVVMSDVIPDGSTLKTKDLGHPVQSRDERFRPVEITLGPDGAIYVADFYESQISHRQHFDGQIEKDTGRIYRLKAKDSEPLKRFDLRSKTSSQLVDLLQHKNRWFRHSALRVLSERRDRSVVPKLLQLVRDQSGQAAIDALWAIHATRGLNDELAIEMLAHANPYVRSWTVRLMCDSGSDVSSGIAVRLQQLAQQEPHVEVRSQLACSARRLPTDQSFPIINDLARRDEDLDDPHIPLLLWWAIEAKAGADRDQVVDLMSDEAFRSSAIVRTHLLSRTMRRFARSGKRVDLIAAARLFDVASDAGSKKRLMAGFEEAYEGRSLSGLPQPLVVALAKAGGGSDVLQVRQQKPDAIARALKALANNKAPLAERVQFVEAFRDLKYEPAVPVLLQIVSTQGQTELKKTAIAALQTFSSENIGTSILKSYSKLPDEVRPVAQSLLSSRASWAKQLLTAVEANQIAPNDVTQDTVWRLQSMKASEVANRTKLVWGNARGATSAELKQRVGELEVAIRKDKGDPYAGKVLFTASCGKCHRLFDSGGEIGPDLTSYKRDDLNRMLLNIVDPSAEIREGYETWLALTEDGRTVTGFKIDEDDEVVVLKGADGVRVSIQKQDLEELIRQPVSVMPSGLLTRMNEQEIRDLFAYLRSSQPLNNRR